jgi:hypothetical protein
MRTPPRNPAVDKATREGHIFYAKGHVRNSGQGRALSKQRPRTKGEEDDAWQEPGHSWRSVSGNGSEACTLRKASAQEGIPRTSARSDRFFLKMFFRNVELGMYSESDSFSGWPHAKWRLQEIVLRADDEPRSFYVMARLRDPQTNRADSPTTVHEQDHRRVLRACAGLRGGPVPRHRQCQRRCDHGFADRQ